MPKTAIAPSSKPKHSPAAKSPTREDIALRAYHIYLSRNSAPGDPGADWIRAEQELLAEKPRKAKPRRKSNVTSIAA